MYYETLALILFTARSSTLLCDYEPYSIDNLDYAYSSVGCFMQPDIATTAIPSLASSFAFRFALHEDIKKGTIYAAVPATDLR